MIIHPQIEAGTQGLPESCVFSDPYKLKIEASEKNVQDINIHQDLGS